MKHQQIGEGEAVHEAPAIRISLSDVVAEYDAKLLAAKQTIEDFHDAWSKCQLGASIGGAYGGTLSSSHISVSPHKFHAVLLSSAWRHVYNGLQIDQVASAKDRKRFEMLLNKPDPFTLENLREQFGDYLLAPRFHILKGLAECFTDLDAVMALALIHHIAISNNVPLPRISLTPRSRLALRACPSASSLPMSGIITAMDTTRSRTCCVCLTRFRTARRSSTPPCLSL